MKLLEILRLFEMGYPQTKIKDSVKCARSTVGKVLKRCREASLTLEKAQSMSPDEIKKQPNLNLRFLWTEYKAQNQDGLEYSQFCERFNRWQNKTGKKVSMHQEREPGKELFVDWIKCKALHLAQYVKLD